MSKILTGKLSASVEHPIVCKTIQKSTDLEQYHGEFASFFFLFLFFFLHLTSLIHVRREHQVPQLNSFYWEIRNTTLLSVLRCPFSCIFIYMSCSHYQCSICMCLAHYHFYLAAGNPFDCMFSLHL